MDNLLLTCGRKISSISTTNRLTQFYSHDEIASIMNTPVRSFEEIYQGKSKEFKRVVKEYIETVRATNAGAGGDNGADTTLGAGSNNISIELDNNRFPIAPKIGSDYKFKKKELEQLYRLYITHHYREWLEIIQKSFHKNSMTITDLACRDPDRQTPFESIAHRNSDFVDPDYLPIGIQLSDPRSMKYEAIIKFFLHIASREASHGVKYAFRFKAILSSRQKGVLRESRYEDDVHDMDIQVTRRNIRKEREKSKLARNDKHPPHNLETAQIQDQESAPVNDTATAPIQISQDPVLDTLSAPIGDTHNQLPTPESTPAPTAQASRRSVRLMTATTTAPMGSALNRNGNNNRTSRQKN